MQRKQLTLVIVSLLVVVLSVSLAWFTTQIIGKGKDVSVTSANLQIVFTDSDGALTETDIEPGWSATKTFTIKNDTKTEYKYNIVIKDLLNTFVTEGYLQYKITSTNDGYNMTEFKDIPKSSIATDTILAYSVVIPNGVTQSYTIEFKYANDENVDQSDDMGKQLSGTLFITEGTEDPNKTLYNQLLVDKSTVLTRTNSEGSIRLLYHGTSTTATNAYIGTIKFNSTYNDAMYVGYMYGTSGSQVNNRTNTNSSTIKGVIDTWYKDNLNSNYGKYLSATAIYCNDRSVTSGTYSVSSSFGYSAKTRLDVNKTPTYNCADTNDKFTADTSTGNGKLTYPIALMTADEVSFAGGKYGSNAPTWYYYNSANESSTGSTWWWVLSPYIWDGSYAHVFGVHGSSWPGLLNSNLVLDTGGVRPVTSLKSCVKYSSGDGTATNPYTIQETTSGC